jgi:hypothetical protein
MLEVLAALAILALASSSVLVVIDRCLASASDSTLRLEAFELARENLEQILVSDSVTETVDYGTSDRYPGISWQTIIEAFAEPILGQMWVRAMSSAQYVDSTGKTQTIELVQWLTPLTDRQAGLLADQGDLEKLEMEQVLVSDEEAAQYAKVDQNTLRLWVENGLVKTDEGTFLKCNLDVFIQGQGDPTPEQKAQQVKSVQELALRIRTQEQELEQNGPTGLPLPPGTSSPDQTQDLLNNRLK